MSVPRWTRKELEEVVAGAGPVLVDLRADWCTRCGPQEQVVERILPEYEGRVAIGSLDVGEHPDVADDYGIQGLPAFLLFQGGEHVHTISGFRRAPELRAAIGGYLEPREIDAEA
ncbi:MAG: thioredoxin family protein [Actinobacteria bacterium]|nr:thioredoxin family protein [Actinomycetota bacterium]